MELNGEAMEVEITAKKTPEQCKTTRALWREKKSENENAWLD